MSTRLNNLPFYLSLNRGGYLCMTDEFTISFLHFSALHCPLRLGELQAVHFLMLSSHPFYMPCFLPPFTVPCKMVLARPDERETCPYHFSLRLFTMVSRSSCGLIVCWLCALQDGFSQTWWTGDMSIPLQFASLYDGQEVFMWSNCLLDLSTLESENNHNNNKKTVNDKLY